jgi:hypothetical protein
MPVQDHTRIQDSFWKSCLPNLSVTEEAHIRKFKEKMFRHFKSYLQLDYKLSAMKAIVCLQLEYRLSGKIGACVHLQKKATRDFLHGVVCQLADDS